MSHSKTYRFTDSRVDFHFGSSFTQLEKITDPRRTILITDEHVHAAHTARFRNWNTIVLKAGEEYKIQSTADSIIEQLIEMEADRSFTLVGIGGGVVTDITGYVASVYMRGIRFGFMPSTVLAMVDASIGGKNGIDVGVYKNMAGLIRQPAFILYDMQLLKSLPDNEWINGFAEIIKHAAIRDAAMFRELESGSLDKFRARPSVMATLVERNAGIKIKVVQKDEFEKGDRRLLNFGHTLGHALENQYELSHGQAVSIGMVFAADLSAALLGFKETSRVEALVGKYELPARAAFDKKKVFSVLRMDKKREREQMNFVLLQKVGKAVVHPVPLRNLESIINQL
ncbi:MAG: 3-dehydroquinate synthase [Chitinophagaceae bacterium]|nr:3-dehydroquinate synthase [Chitinophagaceae bacterium]